MKGYWTDKQISRRNALRGMAAAGGSIAALSLVGCGGSSSSSSSKSSASPAASAAADSTKGKPGGLFNAQVDIFPNGLTTVDRNDAAIGKMEGLGLSSLIANSFGKGNFEGTNSRVYEPDLAQALPEQPADQLTYVYKLKPAKFHNGRAVTSDDVAYSYNRYANDPKSTFKALWAGWFDKIETPDPQTVVVRTKSPYADAFQAMSGFDDAYISCKEHEESPAAAEKILGSGPYIFDSAQAPVISTWKKNPDYYNKPYPYFDQIKLVVTGDTAKQVADFTAKAVDISFWYNANDRNQIKKNRPDAQLLEYPAAAYAAIFRADKPPFNDRRVRQAFALTVNRKQIREAVSNGEGEDDQYLSWINSAWGFRKPKDLGENAKFWNYDPQMAKQLMSAAGIDKPVEADWTHGAPSIGGQVSADATQLTITNWRTLGLANLNNKPLGGAQFLTGAALGSYDTGIVTTLGLESVSPGRTVWQRYWVPAGTTAVKPPTSNSGFVINQELSDLADKQLHVLNFEDRKAVFKNIEDITAAEQYIVPWSTSTRSWFADPSIKNWRIPMWAYRGSARYMMYWWSDKA